MSGRCQDELPRRVLGTTDVAGTEYRLDAPGMPVCHAVVKIRPGRDPRAPSGSPQTGSGYLLRESYSVLVVAIGTKHAPEELSPLPPGLHFPYADPPPLPPPLLAVRPARALPGGDQPGLLAARSADLPARHRRVRDAVRRVHHASSSSAASRCCWAWPSAWRSCRASRRTSRTTSSTSSCSASAPSSTPTASATRSRCPSRRSRTSAAARRSASCRRCAPTPSGSSRRS